MTDPVETSIWLSPSAEDAARLQRRIDALTARFGTARFAPHVTVFGSVTAPLAEVEAALLAVGAGTAPFALETDGIGHSAEFFQAFYIRLVAAPEIVALRGDLGALLDRRPEEAAHPHVSLLYGHLDQTDREALATTVEVAPRYRFDRLTVVAAADGGGRWQDDIEGWRVVAEQPLAGG